MPIKTTKNGLQARHISLIYALVTGVLLFVVHGLLESPGIGSFFARWWDIKSEVLLLGLTTLLLYYLLHRLEVHQAALACHYDTLNKYANDIIIMFDDEGRIVEANERALEIYGYSHEELMEMRVTDLRTPETRKSVELDWDQAVPDVGLMYETIHQRKDGSTFPVEVSARTLDVQGKVWRQAIIRNITDRKHVERALRDSEENLRNIMESSLVSIYVIQDGVFKYVNPTLLEKTGYTNEDLLEQRYSPLDLIAPEYRSLVARNLQERLAGVPGHPYDIKVLCKDGTIIDVIAWGVRIQYQGLPANAGTIVDVTDLKRAELELRKLSRVIEQSTSTVIVTDRDGKIEYINPRFTETTGYTRDEVIGQNPRLLKSGQTSVEEYQQMWQVITSGQVWKGEFKNKRKDGSDYWEFAIISPVVDDHGAIINFVAVKDDITIQKEAMLRLERLAHYDTLTGLLNRDSLQVRLADAIDVARAGAGHVALLSFGLDRFSNVNDSFGPLVGNQLLSQLADRVRHSCRDDDSMARTDGDEFAIVLPDTNAEGAAHVGQKLLRLVQEPFHVDGRQLTLTCSIGIALYPSDGEEFDALLRNAESAQHQASEIGGDNYQFFAVRMNDSALQRLILVNELRGAVQRGELELHYQPQIRLSDGTIDGAEALVRWRHPERGLVSPAEFIPIAEESGVIVDIGQWVLCEACRQAKAWQHEGLPLIQVAVNLSAVQFHRGNVLEQVRKALDASGLEPRYLEVELTESVILHGMENVQGVLQQLETMGVAVSIDDFGTGYSSFTYLRKLHIDKLKIDQSFVRGVNDSEEDAAIVNVTIALAKAFKLNVIAEGVETAEQYRFMKEAGCDQVQGYYCSRPLDAGQFRQMLTLGCPHRQ